MKGEFASSWPGSNVPPGFEYVVKLSDTHTFRKWLTEVQLWEKVASRLDTSEKLHCLRMCHIQSKKIEDQIILQVLNEVQCQIVEKGWIPFHEALNHITTKMKPYSDKDKYDASNRWYNFASSNQNKSLASVVLNAKALVQELQIGMNNVGWEEIYSKMMGSYPSQSAGNAFFYSIRVQKETDWNRILLLAQENQRKILRETKTEKRQTYCPFGRSKDEAQWHVQTCREEHKKIDPVIDETKNRPKIGRINKNVVCSLCDKKGHKIVRCPSLVEAKIGLEKRVNTIMETVIINNQTGSMEYFRGTNIGAVLDMGLDNPAVCSKSWLNSIERECRDKEIPFNYTLNKEKKMLFSFLGNHVRMSTESATFPIWNGERWHSITSRIIEGRTGLIVGKRIVRELGMSIDLYEERIQIGPGRWFSVRSNADQNLVIPVAPYGLLELKNGTKSRQAFLKTGHDTTGGDTLNGCSDNLIDISCCFKQKETRNKTKEAIGKHSNHEGVGHCEEGLGQFQSQAIAGVNAKLLLIENKMNENMDKISQAFDEIKNIGNLRGEVQNKDIPKSERINIISDKLNAQVIPESPEVIESGDETHELKEKIVEEVASDEQPLYNDILTQILKNSLNDKADLEESCKNWAENYSDPRKLPQEDKWMGHDLTDEKKLESLAAKIHHNLGNYDWKTMSVHLRDAKVPQKMFDAIKKHIANCERRRTCGARPLSRPAAFPMATAPFEIVKMDFVHWRGNRIIHMIDAFSRYSVLKFLAIKKNETEGEPTKRLISIFIQHWMAYFGAPRVIFLDPDPMFQSNFFIEMCENFNITPLFTPPNHHQSFGIIERRHQVTKENLNQLMNESEQKNLKVEDLIAVAQMVQNSQISQADGATPGHRVFGRSPRLPIPTIESATMLDMVNGKHAPETVTMAIQQRIQRAREIWIEHDNVNKIKTSVYRAPRKCELQNIFIGQSAYFYDNNSGKGKELWRGPGIIVGMWGHQVFLSYAYSLFRIPIANIRTTRDTLKAIGSDGQLQIHCEGGKVPLSKVVDGETLTFLQRYQWSLSEGKSVPTIKQMMENLETGVAGILGDTSAKVPGSKGQDLIEYNKTREVIERMNDEEVDTYTAEKLEDLKRHKKKLDQHIHYRNKRDALRNDEKSQNVANSENQAKGNIDTNANSRDQTEGESVKSNEQKKGQILGGTEHH